MGTRPAHDEELKCIKIGIMSRTATVEMTFWDGEQSWLRCFCSRSFALLLSSRSFLSVSFLCSLDRFPRLLRSDSCFDHRRRTTSFAALSNFGQSVRDSFLL